MQPFANRTSKHRSYENTNGRTQRSKGKTNKAYASTYTRSYLGTVVSINVDEQEDHDDREYQNANPYWRDIPPH